MGGDVGGNVKTESGPVLQGVIGIKQAFFGNDFKSPDSERKSPLLSVLEQEYPVLKWLSLFELRRKSARVERFCDSKQASKSMYSKGWPDRSRLITPNLQG